jgi:hypothetical protein
VPSLSAGEHVCLLFDADADRDSYVTGFVREGLAAGDKVIYLTNGAKVDEDLRKLSDGEFDAAACRSTGQLTVMTVEETYLAGGRFDTEAMVQLVRGAALSLYGEVDTDGPGAPGWGLWTARQLTDLVEVRSTEAGTVVRLRMALS